MSQTQRYKCTCQFGYLLKRTLASGHVECTHTLPACEWYQNTDRQTVLNTLPSLTEVKDTFPNG